MITSLVRRDDHKSLQESYFSRTQSRRAPIEMTFGRYVYGKRNRILCVTGQCVIHYTALCPLIWTLAETWRRVWGDGKIFRGPRFLNEVFRKNFHFHRQNF